MRYFKHIITALILSGLFLFSCEDKPEKSDIRIEGELVANPIIYEVVVKNTNPDDEWLHECLMNTNSNYLVKQVLKEVKDGNLKAYDYYDDSELSINELKQIIKDNDLNKRTAKIQFEEDWYWDKDALLLRKEVKKLMFGFEIYDATGKVRGYKASFVIDLKK